MKLIQYATFAGALALGCSGAGDGEPAPSSEQDIENAVVSSPSSPSAVNASSPSSPSAANEEDEEVVDAKKVLIADVQLSLSHHVRFVGAPEIGALGVEETWDIEQDGQSSALPADVSDMSFAEMYMRLAGEQADGKIIDQLQQLQQTPELMHSLTLPTLPSSGGALVQPAAAAANGVGEAIGRTTQALCAEPRNANWPLDDSWFRADHCQPGGQFCDTLDPSYSNQMQFKYSDSTYWNMSWCSNASWFLAHRAATSCGIFSCTRRTYHLAFGTLGPRGMPARQVWHVGGKDAADEWPRWTASITSAQGNWVAMHHHGFNQ